MGRPVLRGRVLLQSLLDVYRSGSLVSSDLVSKLTDVGQVRVVLSDLLAVAHTELLNMDPGGPYPPPQLEQHRREDLATMRRVATRTLYTAPAAADAASRAMFGRYAAVGAQVRIADALPHRLLIADRGCAVLPVDPARLSAGALVVREPSIVAGLCQLFHAIWHRAVPLSEFDPAADARCPPAEREVLVLLASGVRDEAAAGELGVSLRTYRRRVAALLDRLGADTRFQAAVHAVERGWI